MSAHDATVGANVPRGTSTLLHPYEALRYRGPDVDADGVVVDRFTVGVNSLENIINEWQPGNRGTTPGTYSRLVVDDTLWMSDTDAECRDHGEAVMRGRDAGQFDGATGLINGLGLGCVLGAWLDVLDHVDVVESDERIARLIGSWYEQQWPGKVTVHIGDAYTIKWPRGKGWTVAWHDIWPSICSDNLEGMATLHRRYGNRVGLWQGSWAKYLCQRARRSWGW